MSKYSKNNIKRYLDNLSIGVSIGDTGLLEDVKDIIYKQYGNDFNYINRYVIEPIDRQIDQLNKYYTNISIKQEQLSILADYLETIIKNKNHLLHEHIKKAINENIINGGWGEDIHHVLSIVGILQNILKDFHIINLFEKDEKLLITAARDRHKITEAIQLLSTYSNDLHLLHYLNNIHIEEKTVSKRKILSSFFYHYAKILLEDNSFNKSQIQEIASEIMSHVFNSQRDYRIYKSTETIYYKDLKLTRYIAN